jgi:ketosteroid isomerase-like protein
MARSVAAYLGPLDLDRMVSAAAPTVALDDHRTIVGFGSIRGVRELRDVLRTLFEASGDVASRVDDVLGLHANAALLQVTNFGTDRTSGGTFERTFLLMGVLGADGLMEHVEVFDVGYEIEALARFDELTGEPAAARAKHERRVRPNAASANATRLDAAVATRELDAIGSLIAEPTETIDHITGVTYDRQGVLATIRVGLDARELTCRNEALATLGDALALCRETLAASGYVGARFDVGAFERDRLLLIEVDATGRRRRTEILAGNRLGDALVRLYERYAELLPDGPARVRAAATARSIAAGHGPFDPDRSATAYASAIESVDHRILGTWSASGAEVMVRQVRSLLEVADDVIFADDEVLCLRPDALLTRRTHSGTDRAGGGRYERVFLMIRVFGADGLATHHEYFDTDREVEALARFDELVGEPPAVRFENAATRAWDRFGDAWEARDWDRVAAGFATGFRVMDRRRMVRLELDRDGHLETLRLMFEMRSPRSTKQQLATRGDRLALNRVLFEASDRNVGPIEVEFLQVVEVDEHGDWVAIVAFDPDDLDAAYDELDDRYAAGEAAAFGHAKGLGAFTRALAAQDLDAMASTLAPDFVVHDHSPLGWGTLDRPAYVESLKALAALAPDSRMRTDHLWLSARGALGIHVVFGTHEGGAYEQPRVTVSEVDAEGRARRRDIYTLDQLGEARARFEALGASAASDPLAALARPNAATAAMGRVQAAFEARDWAAMRAVFTADAKIEDRRRHVSFSGDVDAWIADRRRAARAGVVYRRGFARIAGERLALERVSCTAGSGEGPFEIEHLWLTDVDDGGRITFAAAFDVDDWRAAEREALSRVIAGDPVAAASVRPVVELIEAFNDRDVARLRATFSDDVVFEDHRRTGVGRIEGASGFVENATILRDLAPDIQFDAVHMLACDRHGFVGAGRLFGTLADGGGAFEVLTISVFSVEGGRITRYEVFEPEDADAALARFAELRPDPLRIPPNAAWRTRERAWDLVRARDWDGCRSLARADFTYEDRQKHALVTGDVETWIKSAQEATSWPGWRISNALVGTAGDRIMVERWAWTGEPDTGVFEMEHLRLIEVAADGGLVAWINFDVADRSAALAEAHVRFVAGEAAAIGGQAPFVALGRAFARHDWEAFRGCLAPDAVVCDRRAPAVLGTIDRDQWVASLRALAELAPDVAVERVRIVTWNRLGRVDVARQLGTMRDGGPFETVLARVLVTDGTHVQRLEIFDVADTEAAVARFAELCRGDGAAP